MYINEDELVKILENRRSELKKSISKIKRGSRALQPKQEGKIRAERKGNIYQYYLRTDPKDTSGKYLKRSEDELVRTLLQKEYNDDIIGAYESELDVITRYLSKTNPTKARGIYDKLMPGKRKMIVPAVPTDEQFVAEWMKKEYVGKDFHENDNEYYTQKGERVRSKSEIIIANTLASYGIPYRYECPLHINKLGIVYPDFTALNVRKRKEIIIEHLGMLDDREYLEKALSKITGYELDGIMLGDNLLLTYETGTMPFNIPLLEKKIQAMLL